MQRLDVSGLRPPAPILEIRRVLARLPAGTCLEVIGDDPGLVRDIPAYCAQSEHELVMVRPMGNAQVVFEIAAGNAKPEEAVPALRLAQSA